MLFDIKTINDTRQNIADLNLNSSVAIEFRDRFIHPVTGEPLHFDGDRLASSSGAHVLIHNGIPDFATFSEMSLTEKQQQNTFHDDETTEPFAAIATRPYYPVYCAPHVEAWMLIMRHFEERLATTMNLDLRDLTVLNCGCGGGFEAQYLAARGARVVGFDLAQLRAEAAVTRLGLHALPGFFYRGDAVSLPFADNTFDLVLYHDSLHHVPIEEIPPAVREAVRVARRGVVLLEAHDSPLRLLLEAFGRSISIESSGNYVFRFRQSLLEFWAQQTGTQLVNYTVRFMKKEHVPRIYARRYGPAFFTLLRALRPILNPLGNEACAILKKS